MVAKQPTSIKQAGFAIVVVLASLLILTTLFAIASQRSMAYVQNQGAERQLAQRQADNAAILTILHNLSSEDFLGETITLSEPFEGLSLRLQDVGGLIDLNTAAPELLELLFVGLEFPQTAAADFRSWRREGRRLIRIDDIIRITDADPSILNDLSRVATVFSGRRGIAPDIAPPELNLILNRNGNLPIENFTSAPSGTNFAVYVGDRLIGAISILDSADQSRVLELR